MRAHMVPGFGEPGSIGERPKPEPAAGQLLVRVRAAGVNAMDSIIRAGFVPAIRPGGRIATPAAFGIEAAFEGQPVSAHSVRAATARVGELGELAAAGKLRVPVEVLPLEAAGEAVHRQSTRGNRGKLVLSIR